MRFILILLTISLVLAIVVFACDENGDGSPTLSQTPTTPTETAAPTETVDIEPPELEYEVGQKWEFTYYDSGTKYGSNTYELVRKGTPEGETVYIFESHLKLESSSACKPTTFDTTYHVSSYGIPVTYNMSGTIGKG